MEIPHEGLRELDQYKYHSGGYSKLDNKLNPFWEWCETKVPKSMAPNTVTLIGFGFMAASYFTMLCFDNKFEKEIPRWTYFFAAFCQFAYQTLDAVDGKHARTTKCSSPLGQLFDHGCDSFSMTFVILTVCQTVRLGPTIELLFFSGLLQFAFFCANWSEYHSGVLTTSVAYFGVTEGELVICASLVIAGIFGPDAWDTSVADILGVVGLSFDTSGMNVFFAWLLTAGLKIIVLRTMYVVVSSITIYFIITTLMVAKDKFMAIAQFIPVSLLLLTLHCWSYLPIFKKDPAVILLSSALIFSLITCKLIIGSLTKMTISIWQKEVFVFAMVGLAIKFLTPIVPIKNFDYWLLLCLPTYVIISVFIWANSVIFQISSYLGIYCFSLKKRERRKVL